MAITAGTSGVPATFALTCLAFCQELTHPLGVLALEIETDLCHDLYGQRMDFFGMMAGMHGLVRLPHNPEECRRLYHEYAAFLRRREATIRELISNRTLDEEMQEKIYAALMPQLLWAK
jgi:hypothetical protein